MSDDPVLHERASALFLEVRGLPEGERRSALLEGAAGDAQLAAEVESLLAHDPGGESSNDDGGPRDPERIGPYRVLRRLGHGGSGYVLLAEQDEPVRRRVAIKVVPHAAFSPDSAARFEFERTALERTEHPNIARILDAGRTPDGLPYLVMDYVEGESITEHCRRAGLGLRSRLAMMLDVADAVQHAHQRGVIHRDLKPANILVSAASGRPVPRVLDFGIAKPTLEVTGAAGSPPTLALPLGTPAYMAPEQTGGQIVDTRADVYALGAIIYELACGRPPLATDSGTEPGGGDPLDSIARIRVVVPPPAGRVRLAAGGVFASDPVPRALLDDLDCILAKALEKDSARRYATVAALADDLRRLLLHEPISARPPTLAYRAARFIRRHRALAASLGVAVVALALAVGGLSLGLVEAQRQRREATEQRDAQHEINRFLTEDLLAAAAPEEEGEHITARDLLRRAGGRVDDRLGGRPLIAATVHHTLGVAYSSLGAFDDAQRHLDRAISLRRAEAGPDAPDTVRSEIAAASLLAQRQQLPEAEAALLQAVRRARRILGADDPALYAAINDLGVTYETMDRGDEAASLLREALAGRIRLLGPRDRLTLSTMSNLAQALDRLGETARSLELLLEALKVAESFDEPPRMTLIELYNNIGATHQDLNQDEEAAPYLRRAAELTAGWLGPEHPATLTIAANLAGLEAELGNPARAAELLEEVIRVRERLLGADAFDTLTARYAYWNSFWHAKRHVEAAAGYTLLLPDVARTLGDGHWLTVQTRAALAHALFNAGRPQEAAPLADLAAQQFAALYGPEHPRTVNAKQLFESASAQTARDKPTDR